MQTTPRFLQGIVPFSGLGMDKPVLADPTFRYVVPAGAIAQPAYFRAGNSTDELICAVLMRDGDPMRYFPVGAKAAIHVSLRVVEDLDSGTVLEIHLAAPDGLSGTAVLDLGLVEV